MTELSNRRSGNNNSELSAPTILPIAACLKKKTMCLCLDHFEEPELGERNENERVKNEIGVGKVGTQYHVTIITVVHVP